MTKAEKVIKALEIDMDADAGVRPKECPYYDAKECTAIKDALELLKARQKPPRVLTLEEVMTTGGVGYVEDWFEGDGELPEEKTVNECAWLRGAIILYEPEAHYTDVCYQDAVERGYNRRYGMRVWTAKPSDQEREAVERND